jgi:beta-mannanase
MDNLRKLLGRDPDYLTWYQDWANGNFDEGNRRTLRRIDDRDMTPYIAWEPCDSDGHAIRQPKYSLSTIPQGNHDDYIDSWAEGLAEYGKPVFMNFAYEMNGDWFTWGVNVNGNDGGQDFQNAWRHIHGRFQRAGADNVVWVWSPNKTYDSIPASLEAVYPGDAYVDWLGMNGYNWGNSVMFGNHRSKWETFTQVFDRTYKELVALANKPILIGETASSEEGGRKNRWITSAFLSTIPNNYPNIRAITWFNAKRTGLTTKPGGGVKPTDAVDWRFTSSSKARKAFAHAVQNDYYRESLRTIEW